MMVQSETRAHDPVLTMFCNWLQIPGTHSLHLPCVPPKNDTDNDIN